MKICKTIKEMQAEVSRRDRNKTLGFVPTMGALHEGHLSLVRLSKSNCDLSTVSIYVNPSQFGPQEDFGRYPRNLERDLALLADNGADYVFLPDNEQMYPAGYKTWVEVEGLSSILCGNSRPGHFRGVATIVLKLVQIVKPDLMFMGMKDFQQVVVLETMLRDLNSDTQIFRCPIVRESDGLAMSSRNMYLSPEERAKALCLSQTLDMARQMVDAGTKRAEEVILAAEDKINAAGGRIDYIGLVNGSTLQPQDAIDQDTRMLLAVYIGNTRLIDNGSLMQSD
ncbi:MAG TPA: pantoate--beta-alanine ligase [Candidatus Cloacimonadota bacterium]|jgi:pantoate--beta-alanine ligase|nr:pantoate--beta-alanine ligase [Candidatus Cloacimonadota bacterium]HOF59720.1 pantoate--beta-alanine ligase [Candidatus Cloacimonadota bacterium]HOR58995.1 pantoate--beta-alanine ligase [Candidatus Cloacimonadota bacterium]HPB09519.1 pantoate--beta-alanine ligase [Candidatus Cloacimonadota bacterium]HPL23223.1 pantoate--beta-alanine ligase [Candidatus Cloacimonadota bacterium]